MALKAKKTKTTEPEQAPTKAANGTSSFYDMDLDGIDTSYPLLREDTYECEFASVAEEPSQDGKLTFLHLCVKTAEKGRDPAGAAVAPGYTLHKRINVTETPERDHVAIARDVARIVRDGFGKKRLSDLRPGDRCLVKVRNDKERTDEKTGKTYPPSSRPSAFLPLRKA